MPSSFARPTSGSTWRRPYVEGEVVQLPSGNYARLRPVALDMLVAKGEIPDFLTNVAAMTLWVETDMEKASENGELLKQFTELVNLIVPAVFMDPKIVDDPQADDEISIEHVSFTDKAAAFQLAIQGAEAMRRFREQQEADVAARSNRNNNGDTGLSVGADSGPLDSSAV